MAWVAPKSWVSSDTIADPAAELNRIEENIHVVYDLLDLYVDLLPAQTHKTDWAMATEITYALMQNIDDNIRDFCTLYNIPMTERDWSGIVVADYRCLNEWETLIDYFHDVALILPDVRLCNSFVCGG